MNQLSDLPLAGQRVLVRVDFNVPVESGRVADDTRIREALPTIRHILKEGGRPILMSHFGRPKGGPEAKFSLRPVADHLRELLGDVPVVFCEATVGEEAEACVDGAPEGAVVLLENTRFLPGETTNDAETAAQMARLGDVFVSDAFGSVHRAHASTEGVAHLLPHAAGLLLAREVEFLTRALDQPERPFVAVLGGAKVSDKLGVIEALLDKADRVLIGGAMSYTFLRAQGIETGSSLVEDDRIEWARGVLATAGDRLLLPSDHVVAEKLDADAATETVEGAIPEGKMGLDIGPATAGRYAEAIAGAKTVIWNGPMGVFEMEPFAAGTRRVAQALADATAAGALTLVGGGDSVAAINESQLADRVSHVSTGGGAMLEFLEGQGLPGLAALNGGK